MLRRKQETEAEAETRIVNRARKRLGHVERWGRWYHAFCWGIGLFLVGCLAAIILVIGRIAMDLVQQGMRTEFILGVVLGAGFTAMAAKAVHHALDAWRIALPDPADRLLIQYHDALAQMPNDADGPAAAGGQAPLGAPSPGGRR